MGDFLYVILKKKTPLLEETSWWPFIFEAMHRASLQFHRPHDAAQRGIYFSERQSDQVECTFQELWYSIFTEDDRRLISFWSSQDTDDPFCLQSSIHMAEDKSLQIDITLEDGYLSIHALEQDADRVAALLRASLELYRMSYPCQLSMYWEEEGTPLMLVLDKSQAKPVNPLLFHGKTLQWKEIISINERRIYLPDPFPLHIYWGNLTFVSLPSFS